MEMPITIMLVTMEILRHETETAKKATGNLVLYGRRKVGKTFMVKKHLSPDIYMLAKRGGGFYLDGAPFSTLDSYEQMLQMLPAWLEAGKSVAIDEFQQLPQNFLDYLQTMPQTGRVILTGSSFHIVKNVISPGSPILGLYSDLKLSLISPLDIFSGLSKEMDCVRAFELSPYLRDPWTLQYCKNGEAHLEYILNLSRGSIRALIGEVFLEEEKRLSRVYEG
ncbi:MAG: AAA family ATPase, partial [Candidatus Thermoplasmatota archaeon]|nr:AAA family ATPase [Candidatus Thermoplasmatota archaeon]